MANGLPMGWTSDAGGSRSTEGRCTPSAPAHSARSPPRKPAPTAVVRWWTKKQAEIDKAQSKRQHPDDLLWAYHRAVEQWGLYARWQRLHGQIEEAVRADNQIAFLQSELDRAAPSISIAQTVGRSAMVDSTGYGPRSRSRSPFNLFDRFQTLRLIDKPLNTPPKTPSDPTSMPT